jgi:hypothetical protein
LVHPSGGGSRVGECIEVYGNDNYSIATYDSNGELQYVCHHLPSGEEECVISD